MAVQKICQHCNFWYPTKNELKSGTCKFGPATPMLIPGNMGLVGPMANVSKYNLAAVRPTMAYNDTCGQWKPQEERGSESATPQSGDYEGRTRAVDVPDQSKER